MRREWAALWWSEHGSASGGAELERSVGRTRRWIAQPSEGTEDSDDATTCRGADEERSIGLTGWQWEAGGATEWPCRDVTP